MLSSTEITLAVALLAVAVGALPHAKVQHCGRPVTAMERIYTPGSRIVGGKIALDQSWPWIGALMKQKDPKYLPYQFCGGTVLSDSWVITAGHCVASMSEADIIRKVKVVLGHENLLNAYRDKENTFRSICKVVKHEKYDVPIGSTNNDVALLKLCTPATLSDDIQPACLPSKSIYDAAEGENVLKDKSANDRRVGFVGGWGRLSETQKNVPGQPPWFGAGSDDLQQVNVDIYQFSECKTKLKGYYFGQNMICGGFDEGGKDSCQGDSGGPLILKNAEGLYELQGVVSWGAGCARANMPGIYANVYNLRPWIEEKMAAN
ncbi:hypothetical protein RvY_16065 [Ramazzottius varieornatus]|uniref:limulus clotting factor C n=1 Tax=Ramazzottius varieornatus TaxID=947166 RepID=A0A1D1VX42_RAMVA|nr:hypothetical protein RvY_16065 [Ramazzottius varieornatus]